MAVGQVGEQVWVCPCWGPTAAAVSVATSPHTPQANPSLHSRRRSVVLHAWIHTERCPQLRAVLRGAAAATAATAASCCCGGGGMQYALGQGLMSDLQQTLAAAGCSQQERDGNRDGEREQQHSNNKTPRRQAWPLIIVVPVGPLKKPHCQPGCQPCFERTQPQTAKSGLSSIRLAPPLTGSDHCECEAARGMDVPAPCFCNCSSTAADLWSLSRTCHSSLAAAVWQGCWVTDDMQQQPQRTWQLPEVRGHLR